MSVLEGNGAPGPEDSGPAAQAARAAAAETTETEQPTDRPVPEFAVVGASHVERAAAPTLSFDVEATETTGRTVYTVALTAIVELEPAKRRYSEAERERLVELFGEPERWASTTSSVRWAQVEALVPSFTGSTRFALQLPCSYDHEVAATKYLSGLDEGVAPLRFNFNGTVFYEGERERMQLTQVPWDCTCRFEMPASTWSEMIAAHYPFRGWLPLDKQTIARLERRKAERAMPTLDATVNELLDRSEEE